MKNQMIWHTKWDRKGLYFRKQFHIDEIPVSAKIEISALGIYKSYINGKPLDQQVFLPGRTSYGKRVQYQEYDVVEHLQTGDNVLAAVVGNGWYKSSPKLYAKLTMIGKDGSKSEIYTDDSWRVTNAGPLGFNDMKLGEYYNAELEMPKWNEAGYEDGGWQKSELYIYEGKMIPTEGEKILEQERFFPKRILPQTDGTVVLDFGQNIAGYMEFSVTGKAGTVVDMVYGEVLDENGQFTQGNLSFIKSKKTGKFPQTVTYVLKDGSQTYKPQASVHGFQYVKLNNWPEKVKKENFRAIAVYSDLKQTGEFQCSNELINQLAANCRWSMKGNYLDVPTDCPTRERAGWTGDAMVYCVPAAYQMDIYRFTKKWLADVILEQNQNGSIKNIVPDGGMPTFMDGAAGWSDAIVKIPYVLYQFYGDKEILRMCYPAMKKHIAFMERRRRKRKPWNIAKAGHYDYIIDTGFHWGEWLEPGSSMPAGAFKGFTMPDAEVATAYFAWSTGKVGEIAEILGFMDEAEYYTALYRKIREAYQKEFLPGGLPDRERQCRYVRPLALGLAKESDKKAIAAHLNEMVIKNNYCVGAGFLSTPHVCKVLSDYGYVDTAYRMLENEEQPGWLYEVKNGATTVWENWYGLNADGKAKNSWNHYSPGAIAAWFYNGAAGIEPILPGFQKVRVAPCIGGSLTYMKCSYESVAGIIRVEWTRNGKHVCVNIDTPCPAEIVLPGKEKKEVLAGHYCENFVL